MRKDHKIILYEQEAYNFLSLIFKISYQIIYRWTTSRIMYTLHLQNINFFDKNNNKTTCISSADHNRFCGWMESDHVDNF